MREQLLLNTAFHFENTLKNNIVTKYTEMLYAHILQ